MRSEGSNSCWSLNAGYYLFAPRTPTRRTSLGPDAYDSNATGGEFGAGRDDVSISLIFDENISTSIVRRIERILTNFDVLDLVEPEFRAGHHEVEVALDINQHDFAITHNKDYVTFGMDLLSLPDAGIAAVFAHELIHVNDYIQHRIRGVYRSKSYYQSRAESEVRAYRFELQNASHLGINAKGIESLEQRITDYCVSDKLGCR